VRNRLLSPRSSCCFLNVPLCSGLLFVCCHNFIELDLFNQDLRMQATVYFTVGASPSALLSLQLPNGIARSVA
jgi:hypothetical protein